jgi:hypothetical protein
VRPLGEQLLSGVPAGDAVHVLAQLEVAPLCMGHSLCWEGDTADGVWLLQEGELVTLVGVLPQGTTIRGPALVTPFDLPAWLAHQQEQEKAGIPPHAHTHPLHRHASLVLARQQQGSKVVVAAAAAAASGGAGALQAEPPPPPSYTHSMQAVSNCFLYKIPLSRLSSVVRCLPCVRANLLAQYHASSFGGQNGAAGGGA